MRNLGIPTVIDRMIQQAILQQLQPLWDQHSASTATASGRVVPHTKRWRRRKLCHRRLSVRRDIDLAKFFDRVNHDRLMAAVAARVADRRLLRSFGSFLTAGVLNNGVFEDSREGPRKVALSRPCSRNLVLDELDRELERRGHRFVRYADDCNIYVRSEKGWPTGHGKSDPFH